MLSRRRDTPSKGKPHIYYARGKWVVRAWTAWNYRTCATYWNNQVDAFCAARWWYEQRIAGNLAAANG